jgi:hypothetical protein
MPRTIALTKRISLSEFSEDWDDCYVLVRPATYQEALEFQEKDLKKLTTKEVLEIQRSMIKDHFVSGKVKVQSPTGVELVDMTAEDLDTSIAMSNHVFLQILGLDLDPKGTKTAA